MPNLKVASAAFILMYYILKKTKKRRRNRRLWQTTLNQSRELCNGPDYLHILRQQEINGQFRNFVRMSSIDFEYLITLVGPKIARQNTSFRKAIPVQDRLAVTLRFLATGESFVSLQYLFKMSKQVISQIVPEVCKAIVEALKENIQIPTTSEEWISISKDYENCWNFPHCVGVMDGKHVILHPPFYNGSENHNKFAFSIVLFALVDSNYNFLYVNAGCQGKISDSGVFKNCELNKIIQNNSLGLPFPTPLPGRQKPIPYFIIGNEGFPLSKNIINAYGGQHPNGSFEQKFDYRLCRVHQVVENVFGILSAVFGVLRKPMLLEPEKAEIIVMAITHLHNFLRKSSNSDHIYTPSGTFDREIDGQLVEGTWRAEHKDMTSLLPIQKLSESSILDLDVEEIRVEMSDFFMNEGKIP